MAEVIAMNDDRAESNCREGEAKMKYAFPLRIKYFYDEYISRWLKKDEKAYHTECFRADYLVPELHYTAIYTHIELPTLLPVPPIWPKS